MALRTSLSVQPHLYIGDSAGRPLDYGVIYFGEPNKDPEIYPIDIFFDDALTTPMSQPVTTKGGFINVNGDMAEVYAAEAVYSVKVLDRYGVTIFYKDDMTNDNASLDAQKLDTGIIVTPKFGGIERSLSEVNSDIVSIKGFSSPDSAYEAAIAQGFKLYVPDGDYVLSNSYDMSIFYGVGTINGNSVSADGALSSSKLVQKQVNELGLGFDSTEAFAGSGRSIQGIAYLLDDGIEKLFVSTQQAGSAYALDERTVITEFHLSDDGTVSAPIAFTSPLSLGHGQDLSVEKVGSQIYLWTTSPTTVNGEGAKGVSRVTWSGASTSIINTYKLCGDDASGLNRSYLKQGTPTISNDGKYIVFVGDYTNSGGARRVLVFSRDAVVASANPTNLAPLYSFDLKPRQVDNGDVLQGIECDGKYIYTLAGYANFKNWHVLQKYTLTGELVNEVPITTVKEAYGLDVLKGSTSKGTPHVIEPEGITLRGNELLVGMLESWKSAGDIVSFNGSNYVYIGSGANVSPYNSNYWSLTNLAANKGAYSASATYGVASAVVTLKRKTVWSIKEATGAAGELSINPLLFSNESNSANAAINKDYTAVSNFGKSQKFATYTENASSGAYRNTFSYVDNTLNIYDSRLSSNNTVFSTIVFNSSNSEYTTSYVGKGNVELRSNNTLSDGAGINLYGVGINKGQMRLYATDSLDGNALKTVIFRGSSPAIYPEQANTYSLGIDIFPWSNVYTNKVTVQDKEGVSGIFTSDGKTITVTGGIITRII